MFHRRFCTVLALALLTACTPRGPIQPVPPGAAPSDTVEVFIATNRAALYTEAQTERSPDIRHYRYLIRVPDQHETGTLELAKRRADPHKDFLVQEASQFASPGRFGRAISDRLAALPASEQSITLYVHGFNSTFSEGVARIAQLDYDMELPGVPVHFSWPSAAAALGYAFDRDSTLFSRDALETVMRGLPANDGKILLVAHSMGAQLTMETLRQIEIATPGWARSHLSGVVLISPDIDLDVFRSQALRIGKLPQPFVIFTSTRDRALDISSIITGQHDRLGNIFDPEDIAELEVTLMDVSSFDEGGLNHFTVGSSPALIQIMGQLARLDSSFARYGRGRTGFVSGTVLTVQNLTNVILSPLGR